MDASMRLGRAEEFKNYRATRRQTGRHRQQERQSFLGSWSDLDASVGTDNLFRSERAKVTLRLTGINLTNKEALYNFLSTFSGTHFVTPRAFQAQVGLTF